MYRYYNTTLQLILTYYTAAAAKSLQSCPTLLQPHRQQPTRLPRPWDSPGKNTGVGCHFLLQYRKVKSESEVAQSSPTLRDPRDSSLPGSSVHGILQARALEWAAMPSPTYYTTACKNHLNSVPKGRWVIKGQSYIDTKDHIRFHLYGIFTIIVTETKSRLLIPRDLEVWNNCLNE